MSYSKNVSAEYRLDLDLQMSYACIFEFSAVQLVRIVIKYLFQMRFTIIRMNNKILMNKLFENIKFYKLKLIIIIL